MGGVLVAMSGGVDSTMAASLLMAQGYSCQGLTLKLFQQGDLEPPGIKDAREAASALGIPHHVYDCREEFSRRVIGPFMEIYEGGATPNPCVTCNRCIKFETLLKKARDLGLDRVATGHYARIEEDPQTGRFLLKKAADPLKDQSYVLYTLSQEQLRHCLFPLGGLKKNEVREKAALRGLANAQKEESQDICFIPQGRYGDFIQARRGQRSPEGDFIDPSGKLLGRHRGIIWYTIGQRRGLHISLNKPMYVKSKNRADNTVTLCEDQDLYGSTLEAGDFNWIPFDSPGEPIRVKAKIRYNQAEVWALATEIPGGRVRLDFEEPQRAISPGQAAVLYQDDMILGGGTIL
ncbi:MAG: tRNA 2-thiouridine(34) synthase MnmA [Treponema sp.]|nr:tRNA 2-thiouridine(34) synthase MnmA [Treponema sp.]